MFIFAVFLIFEAGRWYSCSLDIAIHHERQDTGETMDSDGPFKRLLMQPWVVREFAAGFLPAAAAARINLDSFRRYPTETVRRDPKKGKKYRHLLNDVMWQFEFDDAACGYLCAADA